MLSDNPAHKKRLMVTGDRARINQALASVATQGGLVETASGLMVPAEAAPKPEKVQAVITRDEFRKLSRTVLEWKRVHKVSMLLACDKCSTQIILHDLKMECGCTVRTLRAV